MEGIYVKWLLETRIVKLLRLNFKWHCISDRNIQHFTLLECDISLCLVQDGSFEN
jgi:hypothetical protein